MGGYMDVEDKTFFFIQKQHFREKHFQVKSIDFFVNVEKHWGKNIEVNPLFWLVLPLG